MTAALVAVGTTYQYQNFLKGTGVTVVQAASASVQTVTFSSTNSTVTWTNDIGSVITSGTNAAGTYFGGWGKDSGVRTVSDANGNNGSLAISVTLAPNLGSGGTCTTNGVTFTFARSVDGTSFDAGTTAQIGALGTWSFSLTNANITSGITILTNLPSGFVQGAGYIRLQSVAFATNSFTATNGITGCFVGGHTP